MRCVSCGHDNPEINRFCGMCGGILDRRRIPAGDNIVPMPPRATEEPARPAEVTAAAPREADKPLRFFDERIPVSEPVPRHEGPGSFSIFGVDTGGPIEHETTHSVHGPSFLGLGEGGENGDYLLEDEESHDGRKFLLVVVLLVVGGLAYLQYKADVPVTSIWASIKARATGQPAPPTQPQEPTATGVAPTQPTNTKPESTSNPASDANAQAPATSTSPNPAPSSDNANPTAAQTPANPPDKNAAESASASAPAEKPETAAANPEKPGKKSPDLIAKAQHPQSDEDQPSEEETTKPSRKPSPATPRNSEADALVNRAQGFLYGKGGAKSCSTAISLLKQASGRGSSKADSQLGAMYATGNCAPFDRAEAYRWFSKAAEAEPKNAYLQRSRDMMWREMSPQERHKVLE